MAPSPSHEKDRSHKPNHDTHPLQPWVNVHHPFNPPPSEQDSKDVYFRRLYKRPPDFEELARLDPNFSSVLKGRRELDFNDTTAVMQLTKTLLKLDFGLEIDLPEDRLCPPVANRHNYISWLKDLLDTTSYDDPRARKIIGLDIGTGASCIYPLLGCTERPWSFIATDIDEKSLSYAKANVKLNHLESRINVVCRKPEDKLIPLDELNIDTLDFAMTNPPFYESEESMLRSAAEKSRPAFTACTGAQVEMVTPGGEIGFVGRLVDESLVLRSRVTWYTAMLGFLSSAAHILSRLRELGIDNYAVTEFTQGAKTRRWAVAWSFGAMRPAAQGVARGARAVMLRNLLPAVGELVVARVPLLPSGGGDRRVDIGGFADKLSGAVAALELISWHWDREKMEGIGRAADKVWARAWRRRRKKETMDAEESIEGRRGETTIKAAPMSDGGRCVFGFRVMIRVTMQDVVVECRWVEGHDASALESFRGFLKAAAEKAMQ